jgi:hypothetical protein
MPVHTPHIRQLRSELDNASSRVPYAERLKIHEISTQATRGIPPLKDLGLVFPEAKRSLLAAVVPWLASPDVNMGPAVPIGFGAADDLAGHRCDFPNTEEQEADQIRGRITFSPFEVDMRQPVGAVPHSEQ